MIETRTGWRCKIEKTLAEFPERQVTDAMRPAADLTHSNPGLRHMCWMCYPAWLNDVARLYACIHQQKVEPDIHGEERWPLRVMADIRVERKRRYALRELMVELAAERIPERQASRRV
jgi:hypothetical protein